MIYVWYIYLPVSPDNQPFTQVNIQIQWIRHGYRMWHWNPSHPSNWAFLTNLISIFFLLPTYFSRCYFLMGVTVVFEESTSPDSHLAVLQFGSMQLGWGPPASLVKKLLKKMTQRTYPACVLNSQTGSYTPIHTYPKYPKLFMKFWKHNITNLYRQYPYLLSHYPRSQHLHCFTPRPYLRQVSDAIEVVHQPPSWTRHEIISPVIVWLIQLIWYRKTQDTYVKRWIVYDIQQHNPKSRHCFTCSNPFPRRLGPRTTKHSNFEDAGPVLQKAQMQSLLKLFET